MSKMWGNARQKGERRKRRRKRAERRAATAEVRMAVKNYLKPQAYEAWS